jgi:hypothetical protein
MRSSPTISYRRRIARGWAVWGEGRLVTSVPYKLVDAKLLEAFPQETTKAAVGVSSPWVALISYSDVNGTKMAASCLVPLEKIWVLVGEGLVEEQNLEKDANEGVAPAEFKEPATPPGSMQVEDENTVVQEEGSEGGVSAEGGG